MIKVAANAMGIAAEEGFDLVGFGFREKRLVDLVTGRVWSLIGSMLELIRVRACDRRIKDWAGLGVILIILLVMSTESYDFDFLFL